jgi:hypothetical protein
MKGKESNKRILLGLGFDNEDGHKRITQAEEFYIAGGSERTHEKMTETAIKTFEDLRDRGKTISTVEKEELAELLHKNTPAD